MTFTKNDQWWSRGAIVNFSLFFSIMYKQKHTHNRLARHQNFKGYQGLQKFEKMKIKQETLRVVTITMICPTLALF